MKFGKHTPAYVEALAPKGSIVGKVAGVMAKIRRDKDYIDAFRSHTSHNGNVNDNDD
tara:strand:- start:106 stop:276 length:171 start_codon:yes stop_codon:yes gene_type:complete